MGGRPTLGVSRRRRRRGGLSRARRAWTGARATLSGILHRVSRCLFQGDGTCSRFGQRRSRVSSRWRRPSSHLLDPPLQTALAGRHRRSRHPSTPSTTGVSPRRFRGGTIGPPRIPAGISHATTAVVPSHSVSARVGSALSSTRSRGMFSRDGVTIVSIDSAGAPPADRNEQKKTAAVAAFPRSLGRPDGANASR